MGNGPARSLRRAFFEIYFEVGHQLVDLGLRPAGQDYVRFILLGRPRCGSNFLLTSLKKHPNIMAFGELLQQPRVHWSRRLGLERQQLIQHAYEEPQDFISQIVFRKYPSKVSAVGFKLFYHHAREEPRNKIWPFLRDDRDLHVIHLRRRNLLKTILSRKLAERTGQWRLVDSVDDEETASTGYGRPIRLDYDDLQQAFVNMRATEEQCGVYFSGQPTLNLWYEDIAQDYSTQICLVQDFLQLQPAPLQPLTRKQAKLPLNEQIENYAELKHRFAASEWAEFFEV